MVLGKLPVPGRPTCLDKSRARAYCSCSRCGWGWFGHFTLLYPFSPLSPSLWETTRYRLKYCLKGSLSPNTTNQPTIKNKGDNLCHDHVLITISILCINYSRARAYCACSRCGWGWFGHFTLNYPFFSFSLSLGDGPI